MINIIVSWGSKKGGGNDNSSTQQACPKNSILISIVDIPEKYLSNVKGKYNMRKVCVSSVKSSSKLFLCSIREMHNRVNHAKK